MEAGQGAGLSGLPFQAKVEVTPFWNHTRLAEVQEEIERSRSRGAAREEEELTDFASLLTVFGGLVMLLSLWALTRYYFNYGNRWRHPPYKDKLQTPIDKQARASTKFTRIMSFIGKD